MHTNQPACVCQHCSRTHIRLPGDLHPIYCPFCIQRLCFSLPFSLRRSNTSLQSLCQNAFAQIPEVHEFDGLFELVSPDDVPDSSVTTCIDLSQEGSDSDVFVHLTKDPNKVPIFVALNAAAPFDSSRLLEVVLHGVPHLQIDLSR